MRAQNQSPRTHLRWEVVHQLRQGTLNNKIVWRSCDGLFRTKVGTVNYTLCWPQGEEPALIINPPETRAGWYPDRHVYIRELLDLVQVVENKLGEKLVAQSSDEAENRFMILKLALEELTKA